MRFNRTVKAYVTVEQVKSGAWHITISHPRQTGPWAKIKIAGGGNLLKRAIMAVYDEQAGDADAYFLAHGMSDADAFGKNTWK